MKALTLWQPWAQVCVMGLKRVETRSWPTDYTGPLAIHAAKKRPSYLYGLEYREPFFLEALRQSFIDMPTWMDRDGKRTILPTGAIVGKVNLVKCVRIEELFQTEYDTPEESGFGDWSPGRYGWILEEPVMLDHPIQAIGHQRLWDWDGEI